MKVVNVAVSNVCSAVSFSAMTSNSVTKVATKVTFFSRFAIGSSVASRGRLGSIAVDERT